MIPLRSSERIYSAPSVTLVLIVINVLVFAYELTLSRYGLNRFISVYGIVPDRFHWSQLLTSMFIHGGFMHILGNMWFLWLFGRGIEDLLGHGRFLIFYLVCGAVAGIIQMLVNPSSPIPTVDNTLPFRSRGGGGGPGWSRQTFISTGTLKVRLLLPSTSTETTTGNGFGL